MVQIGQWNTLKVTRHVDFGVFLDGAEDGEILLPVRYVSSDCEPGTEVKVFIYFDSKDRLVATTETPKAQVGQFAVLKVVAIEKVGAFLDWGLPKDLFLPFSEQTHSFKVGQDVTVFIYLDKSDRISASMRLNRYLDKEKPDYQEGQSVDLIVIDRTDLGYTALINGRHMGLLYKSEVFQPLRHGQQIQGFIKQLREDGKIDLILTRAGHQAGDDIAPKILQLLQENNGFLEINDKTPADLIHKLFGVSRKKYKIALGGLYKRRLISVDEDGIRLVPKKA